MSLIGVSILEMRQLIEQACLPDRCEVSCPDGANLTIRLGQGQDLDQGPSLGEHQHRRDEGRGVSGGNVHV